MGLNSDTFDASSVHPLLCWRRARPHALPAFTSDHSSSRSIRFLPESQMAAWKVLLIAVLGLSCLGLALATLIVPMTLTAGSERWMWLGGLFAGTVCLTALFVLFLRKASVAMR